MLTWLLLLAPIVAVFVIIRVYKKKSAEREAASSKRFDEIFGGVTKPARPRTALPMDQGIQQSVPPAVAPIASVWMAKPRFLEPQAKLLYYLLKSELPDHEVFAQVNVNAVVAVAPGNAHSIHKVPEGVIDFLVCDKQMTPVAAIRLADAISSDPVGECVRTAGVRWIAVTPTLLPARDQIRRVVLGA